MRLCSKGNDNIAWHTDGRVFLEDEAVVASISLGSSRWFEMKKPEVVSLILCSRYQFLRSFGKKLIRTLPPPKMILHHPLFIRSLLFHLHRPQILPLPLLRSFVGVSMMETFSLCVGRRRSFGIIEFLEKGRKWVEGSEGAEEEELDRESTLIFAK